MDSHIHSPMGSSTSVARRGLSGHLSRPFVHGLRLARCRLALAVIALSLSLTLVPAAGATNVRYGHIGITPVPDAPTSSIAYYLYAWGVTNDGSANDSAWAPWGDPAHSSNTSIKARMWITNGEFGAGDDNLQFGTRKGPYVVYDAIGPLESYITSDLGLTWGDSLGWYSYMFDSSTPTNYVYAPEGADSDPTTYHNHLKLNPGADASFNLWVFGDVNKDDFTPYLEALNDEPDNTYPTPEPGYTVRNSTMLRGLDVMKDGWTDTAPNPDVVWPEADLVLSTGDFLKDATTDSRDTVDQRWQNYFVAEDERLGQYVPIIRAPGDNDRLDASTRLAAWEDLFGSPYKSYHYGDVYFIVLETNTYDSGYGAIGLKTQTRNDASNSTQANWLLDTLDDIRAAETDPRIVVVTHKPLVNGKVDKSWADRASVADTSAARQEWSYHGTEGSSCPGYGGSAWCTHYERELLLGEFAAAGVDLILAGDTHAYRRTKVPVTSGGNTYYIAQVTIGPLFSSPRAIPEVKLAPNEDDAATEKYHSAVTRGLLDLTWSRDNTDGKVVVYVRWDYADSRFEVSPIRFYDRSGTVSYLGDGNGTVYENGSVSTDTDLSENLALVPEGATYTSPNAR